MWKRRTEMRRNQVERTIREIKENKYKMSTREANDNHDQEQMERTKSNGKYWN
jgi:hypothetical protein